MPGISEVVAEEVDLEPEEVLGDDFLRCHVCHATERYDRVAAAGGEQGT